MITKQELDLLVEKYETKEFIKDDPIRFPHRWRGKSAEDNKTSYRKQDIELAGFIASLFAYGNRKMFIKKLEEIFERTGNDLAGYINCGDFSNLKGIEYRFAKDFDIIPIFEILHKLYRESKGLEELFAYAWEESVSPPPIKGGDDCYLTLPSLSTELTSLPPNGCCGRELSFKTFYNLSCKERERGCDYRKFLQTVVDYFYSRAPKTAGHGFYHMIPNPSNGGAMKRMNMLLRWFVRKSEVDLGIWKFMKPKDLLIPLDVHVARMSRNMGLLSRKSNDFRAVLELMEQLREFCPEDPVKYDFAMFAFGVELNSTKLGV